MVIISDNGPGIDPAIRESIYRPFVTSKEYGTGLGLYIAAERIRSIGGKIECQSDSLQVRCSEFICRPFYRTK